MANFLTKLFGTKSDRDLKQLVPIKDLVLEAYETIKNLSNDELRAKTDEFKQLIFGGTTVLSFLYGSLEIIFYQSCGREFPEVEQGAALIKIEAEALEILVGGAFLSQCE